MALDEIKAFWQTIKSRWPGQEQFLRYWVIGIVFIVPLLVFNFGFGATVIRQLVLFVLVAIGALIWLGQVIFGKQKIVWKRTVFGPIALALLIAVLLSSFLANDLPAVWGWRGGLGDNNPWGWLGVLGLGLLITQIPRLRQGFGGQAKQVLISYLLSSTLLALFVIGWFVFYQELIMPALTSFAAASLLFAVNAIIITAFSLPLRGRIKIFWLGVLGVNLLVIFAYDYDVAWYLLGAGMLALSLLQLVWEKKLDKVDFIAPFALIGLSLVLLFAPVDAISKKLGFDFSNLNSVGANVAYPRFFKYAPWGEKLLGAGLGQGTNSFWAKAELVDMRQARQWPPLGSGFGGWLWDGGVLFILIWLGAFLYLGARIWQSAKKAAGENLQIILVLTIGLISTAVTLVLLPFDWMFLFACLVLIAFLSAHLGGRKDAAIGASHGQRAFLTLGAVLILGLTGALIFFSAGQIASRLDFFQSIKVGSAKTGTTVDLKLLDSAISRASGVYGYRLARVDLMVQALQEKATEEINPEQADIKPLLAALAGDYDYLADKNLSGASFWQLGSRAEGIARAIGKPDSAPDWFKRASGAYEKAIEKLPRNVIFLVDAARFYGQLASSPPPDLSAEASAKAEGVDLANKDKFYQQATALLDKALAIDDTYEGAYAGKAELLVLQGKSAEAYDIIKIIADSSPAAAYTAARLAFSGKKYDEAVNYYKKTIAQNTNHLQARYELVQAYMALSDFQSAGRELDELEKLAPKDDAATQNLLKGLRELLKQ